MDIEKEIREYNPKITDSSLATYTRQLKILKDKCDGDDEFEFLIEKDPEEVLDCVSKNPNTRKTYLVSIITMLKILNAPDELIDIYKDEQDQAIEEVKDFYKSGEKSEKQKENWLEQEDLDKIVDLEKEEYFETANKNRGVLRPLKYLDMQNYILLKLYSKYPLRNDLANTKLIYKSQWNKLGAKKQSTGNFLVINPKSAMLVLNKYKTAKTYGQKKIELPEDITELLNHFIKFRAKAGWNSEYLIQNKKQEPMSGNGITKSFLRLFSKYDKKISTSMLRHIILTGKFGEINEEKAKMADAIGNSPSTIDQNYVKK